MTEEPDKNEVSIEFMPNGPALVKGDFQLKEGGRFVAKHGPVALCRCGHSKKKPYCDGSHKTSDFKAD